MMLRTDSQPGHFDNRSCPALIDLAALADGRLADDASDRVAVHVAGCNPCMAVLAGLGDDVLAIESESRLMIVPSPVIHDAMVLRLDDAESLRSIAAVRTLPSWFVNARRGAAIAASVALAFAGYHVGTSFTSAGESNQAVVATISDDAFAFGLLDADATEDDLFTLAFADSIVKEATP